MEQTTCCTVLHCTEKKRSPVCFLFVCFLDHAAATTTAAPTSRAEARWVAIWRAPESSSASSEAAFWLSSEEETAAVESEAADDALDSDSAAEEAAAPEEAEAKLLRPESRPEPLAEAEAEAEPDMEEVLRPVKEVLARPAASHWLTRSGWGKKTGSQRRRRTSSECFCFNQLTNNAIFDGGLLVLAQVGGGRALRTIFQRGEGVVSAGAFCDGLHVCC